MRIIQEKREKRSWSFFLNDHFIRKLHRCTGISVTAFYIAWFPLKFYFMITFLLKKERKWGNFSDDSDWIHPMITMVFNNMVLRWFSPVLPCSLFSISFYLEYPLSSRVLMIPVNLRYVIRALRVDNLLSFCAILMTAQWMKFIWVHQMQLITGLLLLHWFTSAKFDPKDQRYYNS